MSALQPENSPHNIGIVAHGNVIANTINVSITQGSAQLSQENHANSIQTAGPLVELPKRKSEMLVTVQEKLQERLLEKIVNLEAERPGGEAQCLLSLLAYCSQQDLKEYLVKHMCEVLNSGLGVTFPSENGASFEEALHALQALDLVKYDEDQEDKFFSQIKVRPIVQTLSMLADEQKLGLQNILVYNLLNYMCEYRTNRHFVMIQVECLLSDDGFPSWALTGNRQLMLWLHGLRYLRCSQVGEQDILRKWSHCKSQLKGRADAEGIVSVGDFILDSRCFEECGDRRFICPWEVIKNAVQVKSSLKVSARETQTFLELLLLSVIGDSFASTLRSLQTQSGTEELLIQLGNWQSSGSALHPFRDWLSDFVFSSALHSMIEPYHQIEHILAVMIQVSRIISLKGDTIGLVQPQTLFRLCDAEMAKGWDKAFICGQLADLLYHFTGNPEKAEGLLRGSDLLDYLANALMTTLEKHRAAAVGIIRKLVSNPTYVPHVVQHDSLMNSLQSTSFWKGLEPITTGKMTFGRFRSDEGIRKTLPGVVEAAIVPFNDFGEAVAVAYDFLVLKFAINVAISDASNQSRALVTSAKKLLSPEGCKIDLSTFTTYDCTRAKPEVEEWGWYDIYSWDWVAFLTKRDLEQDKIVLSRALEIFRRESENQFLLTLLEKVQNMNEMLLTAVSESAKHDSSDDDDEKWTTGEEDVDE